MRYLQAMALVVIEAALLAAGTPPGAEKAGVHYISAKELQAASMKPGTRAASENNYSVAFSERTGPGQAEMHENEADIFYIVDGSAVLVTGGAIQEERRTAPGELRGKSITGGNIHRLSKGDAIVIPKKTPHWYKDVQGKVRYFVVKVKD